MNGDHDEALKDLRKELIRKSQQLDHTSVECDTLKKELHQQTKKYREQFPGNFQLICMILFSFLFGFMVGASLFPWDISCLPWNTNTITHAKSSIISEISKAKSSIRPSSLPPLTSSKSVTSISEGILNKYFIDVDSTAWNSYVNAIYGETINLSPDNITFLYLQLMPHTKIRDCKTPYDHRPCASQNAAESFPYKQDTHPNTYIANYLAHANPNPAWNANVDYQWVEVTRYGYYCMSKEEDAQLPWQEGFTVSRLTEGGRAHNPIPWGCWLLKAAGTGVFVNVRRSIRAPDRQGLQTRFEQEIANNGTFPPGYFKKWNNIARKSGDEGYCTMALALAYETVQFGDQLIICYGQCVTEPLKGVCPPVELRTGPEALKQCDCTEDYPMLNCGDGTQFLPPQQCILSGLINKQHFP